MSGEGYLINHHRGCQAVSTSDPEVLVLSVRDCCSLARNTGKDPWQNPLFAQEELNLELSRDLKRES